MNGKKIGKGNKVILKHKDEIQLTTQNSDKCTVFHLDFTGVLQVVNCPSLLNPDFQFQLPHQKDKAIDNLELASMVSEGGRVTPFFFFAKLWQQ